MKLEVRNCNVCHEDFVAVEVEGRMPVVCQRCNSLMKARRVGVVEDRKCLGTYRGVEVITDLPAWNFVNTHTGPCFKSDTKGSQGGASWSGRIVIWARGFGERPPQKGDRVNIRLMESSVMPKTCTINKRLDELAAPIHKQAQELAESRAADGSNSSMETLVADARWETRRRFGEEMRALETRRYVVLEPATPDELSDDEREARLMLAFAQAYSKTTLKGLGRQFHASLDTENVISVLGSASGTCRSGRFGTAYVLAVVSPTHPLVRKFSEDGRTETTFYPPEASGFDEEEIEVKELLEEL